MNPARHADTQATMGDLPLLKLVEVLAVAVAGGGFVWWQLRDVKRAQDESRRAREQRQAREAGEAREGRTAQVIQAVPPPESSPPPP